MGDDDLWESMGRAGEISLQCTSARQQLLDTPKSLAKFVSKNSRFAAG